MMSNIPSAATTNKSCAPANTLVQDSTLRQ